MVETRVGIILVMDLGVVLVPEDERLGGILDDSREPQEVPKRALMAKTGSVDSIRGWPVLCTILWISMLERPYRGRDRGRVDHQVEESDEVLPHVEEDRDEVTRNVGSLAGLKVPKNAKVGAIKKHFR